MCEPPAAEEIRKCLAAPQDPELLRAVAGKQSTMEGLICVAKVVSVYDGDTCDLKFRRAPGGAIEQHRVRLAGIDTPEMRPLKAAPYAAEEKAAAAASRNALVAACQASMVGGGAGQVVAVCGAADKYGRLLATLYDHSPASINEWMVANGHAVRYGGGRKAAFVPAP
jgi:endonuclease YncB( thermonuclease family)